MAIIRNSKAITSIKGAPVSLYATRVSKWRAVLLRASVGAVIMMSGSSGAKPKAAPSPPGAPSSASFFDPFDGIDGRRWYVSDGWVNGGQQGCTWSREAVRPGGGMLHLSVISSANKLRAYKCGELQTTGRFGYGTYEARMRIAAGSGLNSAMFTYSGPPISSTHDEIDFEFLGKNTANVQMNYFTAGRGSHEAFAAVPADAVSAFHNYAFVWAPGLIKWYIDGKLVRTASGSDLPSMPGKFYLTLWSGSSGVDNWLGKFDSARLPAEAAVDWAAFTQAGERCRFAQSITCRLP